MDTNEGDINIDSIKRQRPVFLLIMDGWGIAPSSEFNAISLAKTPFITRSIKEYPAVILDSTTGDINNRYLALGSGVFTDNDDDYIKDDLSSVLAANNLKQLKIFDSERLAALTYFYNGRREEKMPQEDWITISSATSKTPYDAKLSTKRIFQESVRAVKDEEYDLIVASCSILDYVASLGDMKQTIETMEAVDRYVKKLASEVLDKDGILIITSTQGNAEKSVDAVTDLPDNKMTNNPVPFIMLGNELKGRSISSQDAPDGDLSLLHSIGSISDIAATIIDILELDESNKESFSGNSLIS